MRLSIEAYAKINLTLDVLGKRPDGYHELLMVMQSVSLCDTLSIEIVAGEDTVIKTNAPELPTDRRNHAYKAVDAFFAAANIPRRGVKIEILKRIPIMAGLGGGSSDAAAVIRALDYALGTHFDAEKLRTVGLAVGADVPFCLIGGTVLARGVGERITPLPALPECGIVIVKPGFQMSTAYVFDELDRIRIKTRPDAAGVCSALENASLAGVAVNLQNVMENVVASVHPEINTIKQKLLSLGACGAVMSGSGPSVFGIFDNLTAAQTACDELGEEYGSAFLCHPAGRGSITHEIPAVFSAL